MQLARLEVKKLVQNARLPILGSANAAGYDLHSIEAKVIPARGKMLIGTGLSFAIPTGNYGRIAPRSGLAVRNSLHTGAGVIDSDYRGEVKVLIFNFSDVDFQVNEGDRICQMIIEKYTMTELAEVQELSETARGEGGFGSTGVAANGGDKRSAEGQAAATEEVKQ